MLIDPITRLTRTAVLEVLGADFVSAARAKSLRETVVIIHHVLRNALIPVVTLIGLQVAFLLGGAVVTETMFSWPGVGRLAVGAIVSSDFPTAQGAIMILAIAFLTISLLVDVLYVYLDPGRSPPPMAQRPASSPSVWPRSRLRRPTASEASIT